MELNGSAVTLPLIAWKGARLIMESAPLTLEEGDSLNFRLVDTGTGEIVRS